MRTFYERGGAWYPVPEPIPMYQVVRNALLNAMAYTDGHQKKAGDLLGLTPRQMTYTLQIYDIPTATNAHGAYRGVRRHMPTPMRIKPKAQLHRVK